MIICIHMLQDYDLFQHTLLENSGIQLGVGINNLEKNYFAKLLK